jgi:hypothetical protein
LALANDRGNVVLNSVTDMRDWAQAECSGQRRLAAAWRWIDIVLVIVAAVLSATAGLTGIARATGSSSKVVEPISHVDPVISGLLAIGASVVAALTFAFAAAKQASDHAVAASEYLKLSTAAADLVTDMPSMTPNKMEAELVKLRRHRDKVLDRFAKLPADLPKLSWLPWLRWRRQS